MLSFPTVYTWSPSACHLYASGGKQPDYVYVWDLLREHCHSVLPLGGGEVRQDCRRASYRPRAWRGQGVRQAAAAAGAGGARAWGRSSCCCRRSTRTH